MDRLPNYQRTTQAVSVVYSGFLSPSPSNPMEENIKMHQGPQQELRTSCWPVVDGSSKVSREKSPLDTTEVESTKIRGQSALSASLLLTLANSRQAYLKP